MNVSPSISRSSLITPMKRCRLWLISSSEFTPLSVLLTVGRRQVMFTPPQGQPYVEPNIFIPATRLDVVDHFVYFSISLSLSREREREERDSHLNAEINLWIEKVSKPFSKLKKPFFV